jgi:competence protein ComEC
LLVHSQTGTLVLQIAGYFLHWVWLALEWLSALPWAQWIHPCPALWTLPFALLGVVLLLAPRGIPARFLGVILLIPALTVRPESPATGDLKLTLLDVGQGLSTVIRTQHHTLVFDTGARLSSGFDMGSAVIEPFLREQGIGKIDALVISHGDNDHIGGAATLLKRFDVDRAYTSVPDRLPRSSALACRAGQSWEWDGVRFAMLSPFGATGNDNDSSCVLKASTANGNVLLTGDIERPAEQILAQRYGEELASEVLIAPHHGSNTSSSREFLNAVKPRYALIPAGYLNRYGFPHPKVIERYREIGAKLMNTADAGAINVEVNGREGVSEPESYRLSHGRYWNARPPQ